MLDIMGEFLFFNNDIKILEENPTLLPIPVPFHPCPSAICPSTIIFQDRRVFWTSLVGLVWPNTLLELPPCPNTF